MLYCSCSAVQLLHCFSGTYSVTAYDFPVDESSNVLPISSQGYQSGCGEGLQLTTQGSSLSCTVATGGVLCVTQTLSQYCQNFALFQKIYFRNSHYNSVIWNTSPFIFKAMQKYKSGNLWRKIYLAQFIIDFKVF